MTAKCETCRFFKQEGIKQTDDDVARGTCRRKAPAPKINLGMRSPWPESDETHEERFDRDLFELEAVWPEVWTDLWCGEHSDLAIIDKPEMAVLIEASLNLVQMFAQMALEQNALKRMLKFSNDNGEGNIDPR